MSRPPAYVDIWALQPVLAGHQDLCFPMQHALGYASECAKGAGEEETGTDIPLHFECVHCLSDSLVAYADGLGIDRSRIKTLDDLITGLCEHGQVKAFARDLAQRDMKNASAQLKDRLKPMVAVVGVAPMVFSPFMNDCLCEHIKSEGCTPLLPLRIEHLYHYASVKSKECRDKANAFRAFADALSDAQREAYATVPPDTRLLNPSIGELEERKDSFVEGLDAGAGWLIGARMSLLAARGVLDFCVVQSFGCVSAHTCANALLKPLRARYPGINIGILEFDAGTSKVNQLNRLKLICSVARERGKERAADI